MLRLRVTLKILHLLGFSARLLLVEIFLKFVRSFCRADAPKLELMVLKILVSSANVAIFEFLTAWVRWFLYKRNNKGPRIDPWGTPEVTGSALDVAPRMVVCWYQIRSEPLQNIPSKPKFTETME